MNFTTPERTPSVFDYDPFGMLLVGRNWEGGSEPRYGFNGKESDNETYGAGNIYDYGFRIFNSRLGKFLSVDPLTSLYPFYSPYHYSSNSPIVSVDIDGLEGSKILNKCEKLFAHVYKGSGKNNARFPYATVTLIKIKKTPPHPIKEYGCQDVHEKVKLNRPYRYKFDPRTNEDGIKITNRETGEVLHDNPNQSNESTTILPPGKYQIDIIPQTDPNDPPCSEKGADYKGTYEPITISVKSIKKTKWNDITIVTEVSKQDIDFTNPTNSSPVTITTKLFGIIPINKTQSKQDIQTGGNSTPGKYEGETKGPYSTRPK